MLLCSGVEMSRLSSRTNGFSLMTWSGVRSNRDSPFRPWRRVPVQIGGPQRFQDLFTMIRWGYPDANIEVEHLVADDNVVLALWSPEASWDGSR